MTEFARPKPKRVVKSITDTNILDEEEYLQKLEKIIKRDFFPELRTLDELRNGKPTEVDPMIEGVSLNDFLSTYTSDENQTFQEIIDREDQRWREKHSWMFDKEENHKKRQLAIEQENNKLHNMIEGKRSNKLQLCDYQTMNQLYFPEQSEIIVARQEETEEINDKVKKVIIENTRLEEHDKPFGFALEQINLKLKETMKEKLQEKLNSQGIEVNFFGSTPNLLGYYGSKQEQMDKYGHVDLDQMMAGTQKQVKKRKAQVVGGYQMLTMPSPAPNMLKSPLMTWGELGETPLRIDRSYQIPDTPKRDQLAADLSTQICKKKIHTMKIQQEQLKKRLQGMGMTPARLDTGGSRIGSSLDKNSLLHSKLIKPSPSVYSNVMEKGTKKIKKNP